MFFTCSLAISVVNRYLAKAFLSKESTLKQQDLGSPSYFCLKCGQFSKDTSAPWVLRLRKVFCSLSLQSKNPRSKGNEFWQRNSLYSFLFFQRKHIHESNMCFNSTQIADQSSSDQQLYFSCSPPPHCPTHGVPCEGSIDYSLQTTGLSTIWNWLLGDLGASWTFCEAIRAWGRFMVSLCPASSSSKYDSLSPPVQ